MVETKKLDVVPPSARHDVYAEDVGEKEIWVVQAAPPPEEKPEPSKTKYIPGPNAADREIALKCGLLGELQGDENGQNAMSAIFGNGKLGAGLKPTGQPMPFGDQGGLPHRGGSKPEEAAAPRRQKPPFGIERSACCVSEDRGTYDGLEEIIRQKLGMADVEDLRTRNPGFKARIDMRFGIGADGRPAGLEARLARAENITENDVEILLKRLEKRFGDMKFDPSRAGADVNYPIILTPPEN